MTYLSANLIQFSLFLAVCSAAKESKNNVVKRKEQQLNIAYGGVLNSYEQNILPNDTDVINIAEFALRFIRERHPTTVLLKEAENKPYSIKDIQKLNVMFTTDGSRPYLVEMPQMQAHPLLWGSTYTFKLIWHSGDTEYHHSIAVTQYWDETLHMFQHTFNKVPKKKDLSQLVSDVTTLQPTVHVPLYQEDNSGAVNVEIVKSSQKLSEPTTYHSKYQSSTECGDDNQGKEEDTCSNDSCDNTKYVKKSDSVQLKILSFNIWNTNVVRGGNKEYIRRIKQIAKLCKESGADVIGFQEVRFEDGKGGRQGPNQVEHLAKILKEYQFVYQPAQIQTSNLPKRVEEGVAFFSKCPVIIHDFKLLSRDPRDAGDGHQRILLHIEVHVPNFGPVHLFNTHLSLSHVARQRTVQEIWTHMNLFSGPAFLMGDFNAEAHNKEVKYLDGREHINGERTNGLHDVWLMQHGTSDPGFTYNTLEDNLSKRIDLIFMRKLSEVKLHNVSLLDDGKRREEAASDHLGLMAIFNMTQRNPDL